MAIQTRDDANFTGNELQNAVLQRLSQDPSAAVLGQIWYRYNIDQGRISIKTSTGTERLAYLSDVQGGGGTYDHRLLEHRDALDQHPTSSITNLDTQLSDKISKSVTTTQRMVGPLAVTIGEQTTLISGGTIQFSLNPDTSGTTPGIQRWNALDQTMEITLANGSVGQLFQESMLRALNNSGAEQVCHGSPEVCLWRIQGLC